MLITIISVFNREKEKVDAYLWRDSISKGTSLHFCIEKNKFELFKKIIKNEPKINNLLGQRLINVQDEEGRTPLHYAILLKRKNFIDFLIENKCQFDTVDNEGKSIFHYCLISNYKKINAPPISRYILCKISNKKSIVFITDTLKNDDIIYINKLSKEYKVDNIKLYFNKKDKLKDEINGNIYLGEKESVPKRVQFITYL